MTKEGKRAVGLKHAECSIQLTFIQVIASPQIQLVADGVGTVVGKLIATHVCVKICIQLHLCFIACLKFLQEVIPPTAVIHCLNTHFMPAKTVGIRCTSYVHTFMASLLVPIASWMNSSHLV